ncbi:retron system putative HNH endonuclease [Candidatus Magnetaquicoccus inordinatus]|uniref:retron system putative HNH endonuclease n=1 Tax=Candidatus Magnetaquicoccus inordinatus TaxID=2496818 RepID=UPI00102BA45A|nr:retron system putative HNH endonuclease [Candidatus Magnetaquicoccus inordinatus]
MRWIRKGDPPPELAHWHRHHSSGTVYDDLEHSEEGKEVRLAIRQAALGEQRCLCAYCSERIDVETSHNEHVIPQATAPNRTLDFANIVASCNRRGQCGGSHGSQRLPLTPLDPACEHELMYLLSGRVTGTTDNAQESIRILNLDGRSQRNRRKQMVETLIFLERIQPEELTLLDDELLAIILDDMQTEKEGCLLPYAPVLANIIRQLLAN